MTVAAERKRLETYTERVPTGCACPECVRVIDHAPRCWRCDKPVEWYAARPWSVNCKWCGSRNQSPPE